MKQTKTGSWLVLGFITMLLVSCNSDSTSPVSLDERQPVSYVLDLSGDNPQILEMEPSQMLAKRDAKWVLVHLKGTVCHFGWDFTQYPPLSLPYFLPISGVQLQVAEYPQTKHLQLTSDENGEWDLYIWKKRGMELPISMTFFMDYYPPEVEAAVFGQPLPGMWSTTQAKSQVITIQDEDILDLGMQFPDELYLFYSKLTLEAQISSLIGAPYEVTNFMVATVGKSWASLFDPTLPHGDFGVIVSSVPMVAPYQGPIYFNDDVAPDPTLSSTSFDGGVLYTSLPTGSIELFATKEGFTYESVKFLVEPEYNVYVASPPHSMEGNNSSGPGL